jgi:hypothetical protein
MAFEIPAEVQGAAAGVLIYTLVAFILNALVVWLTCIHNERTSCKSTLYFVASFPDSLG